MAVCNYYLRGECAFGARCRNEHPPGLEGSQASGRTTLGATNGSSAPRDLTNLGYTAESIGKDFTQGGSGERPMWPLSVYGPAKTEATYITGTDLSPEEMRLRAYEARAQNKLNDYITFETSQVQLANNIIADRLRSTQDTFKHIVGGGKVGPNGIIGNGPQASQSGTSAPAFGSAGFGTSSTSNGFGGFGTAVKPSTPGGTPAPSAPAFGSSSFGTSSFGQPSAFGATSTPSKPAFGTSTFGSSNASGGFGGFGSKPPAFGSSAFGTTPTTSTFGASTAPVPTSGFSAAASTTLAFGQTTFGQPSQQPSAFGQTSNPPSTSAFGGTSVAAPAFGQASQPASTFGQGSKPSGGFASSGAPSGFGQFNQSASTTSVFGQPSQPTTTFGQPSAPVSAFGQASQPVSAFGQSAQKASVFGQPSQSSTTFGQAPPSTSVFGQSSQSISAFGQTSKPAGAFGQPSQTTLVFGQTPQAQTVGQTPSTFMPPAAGPPPTPGRIGLAPDPFAFALPPNYVDMLPPKVKEAFARDNDFEWGNVPEWIPPVEMRS